MLMVGYKNIKRYKEILHILVKYGFTFFVEKLNMEGVAYKIPITNPPEEIKEMSTGERLRKAFEELGPTYIKLGQILSTRKDLLDAETISELSKLRDNVEVFDTELAKEIFKKETGIDIKDAFLEFNDVPIGAASLGQVYEARLKNKEEVIVKIQRPNIENIIKSDLEIMNSMAGAIKDITKDLNIDLKKVISDFESQLLIELDYNFEALNAQKFRRMFEDTNEVYIPKIYDEYCTSKIVVMEKIVGVKLGDIKTMKKMGWDTKEIANIGMKSLFKQIFDKGFFHADPHPGNIFVVSKNCISYIDFGMVGILDKDTLENLNAIAMACISRNVDKIIYILMEMDLISEDTNISGLRQELSYLMHYYYDIPLDKINFGNILNQVFRFLRNYKVQLPLSIVMLAKAIITLEGTARELDPNFSIAEAGKEFTKYYYMNKLNPTQVAMDAKNDIDEFVTGMKIIPKQVRGILRNVEKNNIKINIEEVKLSTLEKKINDVGTQLSLSMVLAALLVGSSLIISSPALTSSKWVKLLAIAGFATSAIVGMLLLLKTVRSQYRRK